MTERFDAVERQVGIESYASSITDNAGFAAVVKARYSDFLVHEGESYVLPFKYGCRGPSAGLLILWSP